jgi:hypothetical protein
MGQRPALYIGVMDRIEKFARRFDAIVPDERAVRVRHAVGEMPFE